MKKYLSLLLVFVISMSLLTACGQSVNDKGSTKGDTTTAKSEATIAKSDTTATKEKVKVGLSFFGLKNLFPATIKDAMLAYVKEKGYDKQIELVILDAQDNAATQVSQIDNLIAQNVKVIMLNPMDSEALVPAVEAANKANIPIYTVNAEVNSTKIATHVGSNDVVAGVMEMQYLADKLGGKGNIIIMHGPSGISAEIFRRQGYENILKKYPDIKILAEPTANWSRTEALTVAENMIQAHKDINAFVCQNDEMAMGALKAVIENKLENKILVAGIDAIPDALQAVKDGKLACTVFQDAVGQGKGAVDVAMKIINGEKVDKKYDIPFVLVTKDMADQYIKK